MDIRAIIHYYHCMVISMSRFATKLVVDKSDGHLGLLFSEEDTVNALGSNMRLQDRADESILLVWNLKMCWV